MVKLIGPALGQAASGSLAGALTFSSSKGRSYVKRYKKPKQPNSKPQMALRAAMTFLSQQWGAFGAGYKATWNDLATYRNISPFNAFQAENLSRFRNHLAPSVVYPATEVGSKCIGGGWDVRGGVREIQVDLTVTAPQDQWAWTIYNVSASLVQPKWYDLIGVLPSLAVSTETFHWPQHTPGTYWITFGQFTTTGRSFFPTVGFKSAVVTG